jgi:hypothetical protein
VDEYPVSIDRIVAVDSKEDGSLGIVWWSPAEAKWRVTTRGSFKSKQCLWAQAWLHDPLRAPLLNRLIRGNTYLFEIICPPSVDRHVLRYDFEGMVALGIYDGVDGRDWPREEIANHLSDVVRVSRSDVDNGLSDMDAIRKMMATSSGIEGVVVRCENGARFKAKCTWYFDVMRIKAKLTPKELFKSRLLAAALTTTSTKTIDECLEAARSDLSNIIDEESRVDFEWILAAFVHAWSTIVHETKGIWDQFADVESRVLANIKPTPSPYVRVVLLARNRGMTTSMINTTDLWKNDLCRRMLVRQMELSYMDQWEKDFALLNRDGVARFAVSTVNQHFQ